jgi:hypothetical protein
MHILRNTKTGHTTPTPTNGCGQLFHDQQLRRPLRPLYPVRRKTVFRRRVPRASNQKPASSIKKCSGAVPRGGAGFSLVSHLPDEKYLTGRLNTPDADRRRLGAAPLDAIKALD